MFKRIFFFIILFSSSLHLQDTKSWVVDDIRITGLQRVSAGSIFAVMPIGLGDEINEESFKEIALSIFETGKFDDIKLGRDGNALLIDIKERPTIDEIFIEGNKQIKTDALLDGLKNSGISEGALYKRSVFESLSVELERQYSSQGKYSADGIIPKIDGGTFIAGKFEDTLPTFYSKPRPMASLINFDADLYSSTLCALNYSKPVIDKDTILIFDEFIIKHLGIFQIIRL